MAGRLETNELNEVIRFGALPDDVLLDIFDFYKKSSRSSSDKEAIGAWQTLVHVCQRWRNLVFLSPRRLNLQLVCTPETSTRDTLDVWPALPLIVWSKPVVTTSKIYNIFAALGHSNRVSKVDVTLLRSEMEEVLEMMQVSFPELTDLHLSSKSGIPVIPDSFLDGSAPRLRRFALHSMQFPGLPDLLLSATQLVELSLTGTRCSRYILPEAIVALLSTLSFLKTLSLESFARHHPDRKPQRLHLRKLSILPALETFKFHGDIEYLEGLVTIIDTPQLNSLEIMFRSGPDFDIQRLAHFINCTPKLSECDKAHIKFNYWNTHLLFGTQISITCYDPDRQLSFVSQIGSFSITSAVKDLYIENGVEPQYPKNNAINTLWLQLLVPFTAVKNLYLHKEFAPGIAAPLKELVGGRITEVLPSLENIFVEELESFEQHWAQFVVARQLSGHPVAIFDWIEDSDTESI